MNRLPVKNDVNMNNNRNKKIEEILGSLDGVQKATVPDFFYTRLKAKMEKGLEPATKKHWVLRPAFAITALVMVLVVNAFVIFRGDATSKTKNNIASGTESEILQSIASEYRLNDNNSSVYDLTQDK